MDSSSAIAAAMVTPVKKKSSSSNPSKINDSKKCSENFNPNLSSPKVKSSNSPSTIHTEKSAKKAFIRNPNPNQMASPLLKSKIRDRKFVIAKKKSRNEELNSSTSSVVCQNCKKGMGKSKCLCVAYKSLRASQEEFSMNPEEIDNDVEFEKLKEHDDETLKAQIRVNHIGQDSGTVNEGKIEANHASSENSGEEGESGLKRSRDRLLEDARVSVPEPGSGRVKHLVKAFENFNLVPSSANSKEKEVEEVKDDKEEIKWELPGLQQPPKASEMEFSQFNPSDLFLTSESLGLDSARSYSLDSSQGSVRNSIRTSADGRTSRRRSSESSLTFSRRHCKRKQLKPTSQKPFMLRTEQRGKCKEEEFMKKLQLMMEEEKKLQIPIAQGLPWTTDEPECLVKPPVKENTRPINLVLHSDIRAEERAEFDHQVAKKMSLIEEYRMERDRQQKLAEEEEIRRLRKEIIPKAQPMPYFDRPFIPRRSTKHPTIPREPKSHVPQQKKIKCCMSLDDNCSDEYEG